MSAAGRYSTNVFVNCPFDQDYDEIFRAIVFAVESCGFRAHCALEIDDGSQVRIDKLFRIIGQCQFGIHDLSRTGLDEQSGLPRFNMPLELGMFLAARRFGTGQQKRKNRLILDSEPYRFQTFISDISGQDVRAHSGDEKQVITVVRNWLRTSSQRRDIPGGSVISDQYDDFRQRLPRICDEINLAIDDMTFLDYADVVAAYLQQRTQT